MGDEGIGPSTSVLSGQRSTNELIAHQFSCRRAAFYFTRQSFALQNLDGQDELWPQKAEGQVTWNFNKKIP